MHLRAGVFHHQDSENMKDTTKDNLPGFQELAGFVPEQRGGFGGLTS
jgi:hypothetical protein